MHLLEQYEAGLPFLGEFKVTSHDYIIDTKLEIVSADVGTCRFSIFDELAVSTETTAA